MTQAKTGDTVKVHYTGTLDDGTVFDSSAGREPMQFIIGEGRLISDFEQAVIGMNAGESKTVKIEAENAYGPRHEELIFQIDRNDLPASLEPQVDQKLQVQQREGQEFVVTVTEVTETNVTLDGNHPLAGKDLTFEIQLAEIG